MVPAMIRGSREGWRGSLGLQTPTSSSGATENNWLDFRVLLLKSPCLIPPCTSRALVVHALTGLSSLWGGETIQTSLGNINIIDV